MPLLQDLLKLTLIGSLAGCASVSGATRLEPQPLPNAPVALGAAALHACPRWKVELHGHLSHISASSDATRILVSTSAEAGHEARLRLLSSRGKVLWLRDLGQPVKAQSISSDGRYAAINTYDGKMALYDTRAGRRLWEADHLGRPVLLGRTRRLVLLNDDDSEPKTAFVTYDLKGKRLGAVTSEREPLEMTTSDDESLVAVTATDRSLAVYSPEGALKWRGRLEGDAVALEVSGGAEARVYALTMRPENKLFQDLSAYGPKEGSNELTLLWKVALDRRYETVRRAGDSLFLYGNTHFGQALAAHSAGTGAETWRKSYSSPASYSSLVFTGANFMTAALDELTPAGLLHVMAIDSSGSARWDAPVEASSGLYSYAFAESAPALVVGAGEPGDGSVEFLGLASGACAAGSPKRR